ncbi:MAG: nucleotidyltransferase family protein [Candidatus Vogelbacteria bacterium]|nr:nucleotidyltransferase family protein [Candidatus Vogelbacteria bacterium]
MQVIILAAGRGTRLRPVTDDIPKPMVNFRGVPLLEYTLSILPIEVDHVIIVIGWLGHKIENYFGRQFFGRKINYVPQSEPKGTFHAIKMALPSLTGDNFMIVSGDDVYHKDDLAKVAASRELSLLATETKTPERFGICKIGENGYLESIVEKPKVFCGSLAGIGVYKLNKKIFDEPVIFGPNGEELLAPMIGNLAASHKIEVIPASFWHPIADLNDLEKAQRILI